MGMINSKVTYFVGALLLLSGCQNLQELSVDGTCGNRITEPLSNEDCDGFAPMGLTCGTAGKVGACRFTCATGSAVCPSGWSCGSDQVCRFPSGELVEGSRQQFAPAPGFRPQTGDFDGDGRQDLVAYSEGSIKIRYGGGPGGFTRSETFRIDRPDGELLIADVNGDRRSDVVAPLRPAPLLLLGGRDGLVAKVNPTLELPVMGGGVSRTFNIGKAPPNEHTPVSINHIPMGFTLRFPLEPNPGDVARLGQPQDRGEFSDAFAVLSRALGRVQDNRDLIAVSFKTRRQVYLIETECSGLGCTAREMVTIDSEIMGINSSLFTDIDGNGQMDLLLIANNQAAVAYRMGNQWCPNLLPNCPGENTAGEFELNDEDEVLQGVCAEVLGAYELSGDELADFVTPCGVFINLGIMPGSPRISTTLAYEPGSALWNHAVVGDFNRDGFRDLALSVGNQPSLTFLIGTGTRFLNPAQVSLSAPISTAQPQIGDVDGDLYEDLVFADTDGRISVLFGDPQGAPSQSTTVGTLSQIRSLSTGNLSLSGTIDGISDLIVVSSSTAADGTGLDQFTILAGSAERQMLSRILFATAPRLGEPSLGGVPSVLFAEPLTSPANRSIDLVAIATPGQRRGGDRQAVFWTAQGDGSGRYTTSGMTGVQPAANSDCTLCADFARGLKVPSPGEGRFGAVIFEDEFDCGLGRDPRAATLISIDPANPNLDLVCTELPTAPHEGDSVTKALEGDFDGDGQGDLILVRREVHSGPNGRIGRDDDRVEIIFNYMGQAQNGFVDAPELGVLHSVLAYDVDADGIDDLVLLGDFGVAAGKLLANGAFDISTWLLNFDPDDIAAATEDDEADFVDILTIDANGDGLKDLLLFDDFEFTVFLSEECDAALSSQGLCSRPEIGAEQSR